MAVKNFIDEALRKDRIVALVSLDVKGAFDAAWWPSILKALKDFQCPRNLYNLTRNYFSEVRPLSQIYATLLGTPSVKFGLYLNKQYEYRKSSKQTMSPRVLQWSRVLEYSV
jgi:hypothetical protein